MVQFNTIEDLATSIQSKLHTNPTNKKVIAMYAFNGTWKTRISNEFNSLNEALSDDDIENIIESGSWSVWEPGKKVLCYNAFLEDLFSWDNDNCLLSFDKNSWEAELIETEWLEPNIIDNFQRFLNTKIEPYFDLKKWQIIFNISSWDDDAQLKIKISRGEESVFIWSVFYTILELIISELNSNKENRSTTLFNDLEYIVIDDPVSSIDDTKIIDLAIELIELLKWYTNNKLKILITTHHALFYNILVNSFKRMQQKNKCDFESYVLSKKNNILELKPQNDSPFAYHLSLKDRIQNAIDSDNIEKYHFNLFRNLLEKTSIFLWYNNWSDCIDEDSNKEKLKQCLQNYSHSKWSDLEWTELSTQDKDLLKETFESFLNTFSWKK